MKKQRVQNRKVIAILMSICLVFGMFQVSPTYAAAGDPIPNYESYSGFTTSEIPVLPVSEVHPKLWFSSDEISALYEKRNADEYAKSLWNSITNSRYLVMELPNAPIAGCDSSLHGYYGDMARIAKYNAFMFVMEGEQNYKERAISALLRAFDGPIYECDPVASSSPIDETYRALWVQNFAAAYDWVHAELSPEEDQQIRSSFEREAELTYENIHIWGPRPHNHRSKPAWGLGSLALVMSDHEDAAKWLQKALEMANTNTKYFFSSDGVYREGSQYYIYSHINFLPFLYHYKNVSNVDLFQVFKPAFEWEFNVSNNKGWMPNFADSYIRHNHLNMVASQFMSDNDLTSLHPTAKLGNLYQWRYMTTDKEPWGGEFGNNTGASYDDTMDLDRYLTYDPSIEPIAPVGTGTSFFNEGGQTIFRNNWDIDDPSSRYLLFQGVADMDNHNHFDQLSFIMHAENQMMASDSGYSRSSYGEEIRRAWYRTAEAHNTVTLNGTWPVDIAQNVTPASKYSMDTDFFDFQQKEARYIDITNNINDGENDLKFPPDSESLGYIQRAIAFPNQQYFVVVDQLSTKDQSPQRFELYLHGGRGSMQGEENFRQWIYSNDAYGSSAKLSSWIFSNEASLTNLKGEVSYVKDDYVLGDYVKASVTAANANFMQILIPQSITASTPLVTEMSDENRVGGTVEMDGFVDTYMVQQGSEDVSVAKLTTNGDFAYVRDNGLVNQYSVRQATGLSIAAEEIFSSSERVTLAMDVSNRSLYTGMLATDNPALTYTASFKLPVGKEATSATFNGVNIDISNVDGYVQLASLTGQGNLTIHFVDSGNVDVTAPAVITNLSAVEISADSVQLLWTASGNNGTEGTAAFYDVRYHTEPITEGNWEDAVQVTGEPKPKVAGASETMLVRGLSSDTNYYFAIKAGDEALNLSALSNITSAKTAFAEDLIAPGAITDFKLVSVDQTTAQLEWTAPGDDNYSGRATAYELRYSTSPINNEDDWEAAQPVTDMPSPEWAGTKQSMTVTGLSAGRTYFMAIRAIDEANNRAGLSNPIFASLEEDESVVQLRIHNVSASLDDGNVPSNTIDNNFQTRWSALSLGEFGSRDAQWIQFDLGISQTLSHMKIAFASGNVRKSYFDIEVSMDGVNWTKVRNDIETSGMTLDFETHELNNHHARWVRIVGYGNSSSGWNSIAEVAIYGQEVELPPVSIGEVSFTTFTGEPVSSLVSSTFLKVNMPISNNQADTKKLSTIIALYRPDRTLEKMVIVTSEIDGWTTESINGGFTLPSQVSGYEVKIFVWDSLEGMQPLTDSVTFPQ